MEDSWPMIERCMLHQLQWEFADHQAEMVADGVWAVRGETYRQGESIAENQEDFPPAGSFIPIDWNQGASPNVSDCE